LVNDKQVLVRKGYDEEDEGNPFFVDIICVLSDDLDEINMKLTFSNEENMNIAFDNNEQLQKSAESLIKH
jgi:hypothetical protein